MHHESRTVETEALRASLKYEYFYATKRTVTPPKRLCPITLKEVGD